jgi:hypothetical protein
MANLSFTCNELSRVNFLAEFATQKFNKHYGNIIDKSPWRFLVNDYYSTGEGRTISLMITQALPRLSEDFDEDRNGYKAVTTKEYRAIREFYEVFGEWGSKEVEFLPDNHFFGTYSNCLPPLLHNIKDDSYYSFYTQLHFNLS